MLNVQRRMPSVLSDFVSGAFYQDALGTVHPGSRPDPVFTSPFAVVDTSDQPENRRREKRRTASEEWMQAGYVNYLEAEVIARIVAERIDAYEDWAVILPYRAQVIEVSHALARRLGGLTTSGHVGTVDSFQGGERDLVVYGFTRSNRYGKIGFLSELRRINVAITRARRQLVVVGDMPFLCRAQDAAFATLLRSLSDYVAVHGDRRSSLSIGLRDPSSDGNARR
jgi:superfamily I DNA and/or RNA helicase